MPKRSRGGKVGTEAELAVNMRVRVTTRGNAESRGVVVDDFGEMRAESVDIGSHHFADPARRWAVALDSGDLVFVDSDQLVPE